jgi:hypothetical protein
MVVCTITKAVNKFCIKTTIWQKRLTKLFSCHDRRHNSKLPEFTQYETNIPLNTINMVTSRKSIVHCKSKVFHTHTIWHCTTINQYSRQQSRQLTPIPTYNHDLCLSTVEAYAVLNRPTKNCLEIHIQSMDAIENVTRTASRIYLEIIGIQMVILW